MGRVGDESPLMPDELVDAAQKAVDGRDKDAVRDGMGALDSAPGVELRGAEFLFLGWMPANRCGIKAMETLLFILRYINAFLL